MELEVPIGADICLNELLSSGFQPSIIDLTTNSEQTTFTSSVI